MASVTITVADVAARYEGELLDEFREEYVQQQVTDAVAFVDDTWRAKVEARLSGGQLSATTYKRIIATAVLRVIRNPDGYTSENEGGYGNSRRADVASGNLWFTSSDIEALTGTSAQTTVLPGTVSIGLDRGWSG